jgi:hypothetical protein
MICTIGNRTVFIVKLKYGSRAYLTARAAASRMAREKITKKYPTEKPHYSEGRMDDPGFYWRESIPKSEVLYRRMTRIYLAQIKSKK